VGDIGIAAGLCYMVGGLAGLIGGGALGYYVLRFGAAARLTVCAASTLGAAVCAVIYPLLPDAAIAMVAFGGFMMCGSLPLGVANAALQMIVHGSIRGVVSSIYYLVLSLVAILGPTLIDVLADRVFPQQVGLRYATAIVLGVTAVLATLLFLWVTPAYRRLVAQSSLAARP
jgi:MFS family permease